jgi:endoglycosylceramidase
MKRLRLFEIVLPGQSIRASDANDTLLADWATDDLPEGNLTLDGRWIRDAQGRALLLRGFNLSADAKTPPYLPIPHEQHLDRLASWGINCIRLVLVWEALEPRRGEYNQAYLEKMVALARAAWQRGIYTIVDMHQDLFSRELGGSGAPVWAHPPVHRPRRPGRFWFSYYLIDRDVNYAFKRFWDNADFIRDSFVCVWQEVARCFAGVEGVIGYDLFNEPSTRFFPDLLSGHFDREILPDFYRQVAGAIRAIDPYRLILVEPSPRVLMGLSSLMDGKQEQVSLHQVKGLVYAPHIYDGVSVFLGRFYGSSARLRGMLQLHLKVAARLRAACIIGEFGVLNYLRGAHKLYAATLDLFDRAMVNWVAWNYMVGSEHWNEEDISVVYPDGQERVHVNTLVRPYPRATAGTPLGMSFDIDTHTFIFSFATDPAISAPTEIYLPHRHYPHGFDLRLSQGLTAEYNAEQQLLRVQHAPDVTQGAIGVYARGDDE